MWTSLAAEISLLLMKQFLKSLQEVAGNISRAISGQPSLNLPGCCGLFVLGKEALCLSSEIYMSLGGSIFLTTKTVLAGASSGKRTNAF
ncbi:hypothetical protein Bca4012_081988 [Brassica carinata]